MGLTIMTVNNPWLMVPVGNCQKLQQYILLLFLLENLVIIITWFFLMLTLHDFELFWLVLADSCGIM